MYICIVHSYFTLYRAGISCVVILESSFIRVYIYMYVCVYVLYLLVHCLELKWYWLKRAHYCAYLKNWIHSLLQHTVLLVSCEHIKKK